MESTDKISVSPLCCCEYYNLYGHRTHVMALCCDCEELDNSVDRCLKGQGISRSDEVCKVVSDRIRIPWLNGAARFDMEIVIPVIILSSSLYVASFDFVFTVLSLVYLPIFVIVYYAYSLRNKKKTWFFVSWACTSIVGIYGLYIVNIAENCSPRTNVALTIGFVLVVTLYYRVVASKDRIKLFTETTPSKNGVVPVIVPVAKQQIDMEQLSCCFCIYGPFARVKHCRICGYCVPRSDHHCVWTNCCIGHHNQLLFLLTIIAFIISGSCGIYFSLNSICQSVPNSWYFECSQVYRDSRNAIMFVSSFYTIIFVVSMMGLLLQQVFFISFNITGDEWRRASRKKTFWQILMTNPYDKGFIFNWTEFLFPNVTCQISYEYV